MLTSAAFAMPLAALFASPKAAGQVADLAAGQTDDARRIKARDVRVNAAQTQFAKTPAGLTFPTNGDEARYDRKFASYSKGLRHLSNGEVDPLAFTSLLDALHSEDPKVFERIQLGTPNDPKIRRKLTNPQAGIEFDLEGADSHAVPVAPAPAFASREEAAEMAENYWMAILRDTPFTQYGTNVAAEAAADDLAIFGTDFKGPKDTTGQVTPATLFRGLTPGDLVGPYISQFLWLPAPFGADLIEQRIQTTVPGIDFMTDFTSWLDVQNGAIPRATLTFDPTRRFPRNGRDLSEFVHIDNLFQTYFTALLVMFSLNAPTDIGDPYRASATQEGFGSFGRPHILTLVSEVATRALHAAWFQKWFVHRRLRPEVFGERCDRTLHANANYPVHPEILAALTTKSRLGGFLPPGNAFLPMAYPEGSPLHPSYLAGHATVAGACVTVLKAWFNESTPMASLMQPIVAAPDGLSLRPYTAPDAGSMTIGGELNKLASNIGIARNIAGVHWRSDATASLAVGEAVAISILSEFRTTINEDFEGFSLTKFDGTQIIV